MSAAGPVVRFRRITTDAKIPEYQSEGASGMDLHSTESFSLAAHATCMISTGIGVMIPEGYEGQVRARSGLAAKFGIGVVNGPATIDSDYRGELKVLLVNHSRDSFFINHGDRIAQFVIAPVARAEILEVDEFPGTKRGESGFGSTGVA